MTWRLCFWSARRTGHDKLKNESERETVNKWMRRVLVINIMFQKRFRHVSWRCSAEIINWAAFDAFSSNGIDGETATYERTENVRA